VGVVQGVALVMYFSRDGLQRVLVMCMGFIAMNMPLEYKSFASIAKVYMKKVVHRRVKNNFALQQLQNVSGLSGSIGEFQVSHVF